MWLACAYQVPELPTRKGWRVGEDVVKGLTVLGLVGLLSWGNLQNAPVRMPQVDFDRQQPVGTSPMPTVETDLFKWAVTQGGLTIVILAFLWFDRRERQRDKEEAKRDREELKALIVDLRDEKKALLEQFREEKQMLAQVVEKNTAAGLSQALATAANTQATQTLAQNIDRLERSIKP